MISQGRSISTDIHFSAALKEIKLKEIVSKYCTKAKKKLEQI
jgi:hypothetical protein